MPQFCGASILWGIAIWFYTDMKAQSFFDRIYRIALLRISHRANRDSQRNETLLILSSVNLRASCGSVWNVNVIAQCYIPIGVPPVAGVWAGLLRHPRRTHIWFSFSQSNRALHISGSHTTYICKGCTLIDAPVRISGRCRCQSWPFLSDWCRFHINRIQLLFRCSRSHTACNNLRWQ